MGFKELCPAVQQNSVLDTKCSGVFQFIKTDFSYNAYDHSDLPALGETLVGEGQPSNSH
jgi:hypothetical protein